jgi:hypothetical protein
MIESLHGAQAEKSAAENQNRQIHLLGSNPFIYLMEGTSARPRLAAEFLCAQRDFYPKHSE